ncbi:hypothetical protein JCM8547_001240 [Rhodosporidiobolus lusitaniae]
MATFAELLGWDTTQSLIHAASRLAASHRVNPDDLPQLAPAARALDQDVRDIYSSALAGKQREEKQQDRSFLERAREFVELNEQVDASTQLLTDLSSFLATFQTDLSAVSGHISELQGRSKTIEGRLQARKAVERSLHPFITSITLSPSLITTIIDTDPASNTAAWIPAVRELDAKLGAIRGGARVESRKTLDEAAEALRVAASSKILTHLTALLRPYTLSISLSLPTLHASLLSLKPLFDFLRRHAARQAHDVQKAYSATVRWYYETAFRRYVRALEKVRSRAAEGGKAPELIGSATSGGADSLALLNQRRRSAGGLGASPALSSSVSSPNPNLPSSSPSSAAQATAVDNSQIAGPGVILAHLQNDKSFKPPPEALFRSISLVLADNATSEYAFLAAFFGQHSALDLPSASSTPSSASSSLPPLFGGLSSSAGTTTRGTSEASESVKGLNGAGGQGGKEGGSESGKTVVKLSQQQERDREREKEEERKVQRVVVEGLWKSVMEPAVEYVRNFTHALLDPVSPSALSLLSMIHLNDALLSSLSSTSLPPTPVPSSSSFSAPLPASVEQGTCPTLAPHLISTRMLLFPAFSKLMSSHADSLRRINGSQSTSTLGSMFGGGSGGGSVKDSQVDAIVRRYAEMFCAVVALSEAAASAGGGGEGEGEGEGAGQAKQDDEMVFSSLLRIRQELDKLLLHQASKMSDPQQQKAFLRSHYEGVLAGLSAGLSRHARSQAEVAHYRELARKAA